MLLQTKVLGYQLTTHNLTSVIQNQMMNITTVLGLGVELHRQSDFAVVSQRKTHIQGWSLGRSQSICQHHQTSRSRQPFSGRQSHSLEQQV
jgi:hypothetical protein